MNCLCHSKCLLQILVKVIFVNFILILKSTVVFVDYKIYIPGCRGTSDITLRGRTPSRITDTEGACVASDASSG